MPVVGVASKLRQPSVVGTKPVHTALPIPKAVRAATLQSLMTQQQELRANDGAPGLNCQLSVKSQYQQGKTPEGKSRSEESKICKVSEDGHLLCISLTDLCLEEAVTTHVSGMKEPVVSGLEDLLSLTQLCPLSPLGLSKCLSFSEPEIQTVMSRVLC